MCILRICFSFLAITILVSCDSTVVDDKTALIVDSPYRDRQIQGLLDSSYLRADVVVNGGAVQSFDFPPNQRSITAPLTGIVIGDSNTISVTWYELLNGYDVEVSFQEQTFIGEANVTIDSTHRTSQFDYDNDGQSNIEERVAGTCVWSATEICLDDNRSDIPPQGGQTGTASTAPPISGLDVLITSAYSQTGDLVSADFINRGLQTLHDHQFTNGDDGWATDTANGMRANAGIICAAYPPGQVGPQGVVGYWNGPTFYQSGTTYVAQFDLMVVERKAPVQLGIGTGGQIPPIVDHYVQGTTQWQTHTIRFTSNQTGNGSFSFLVVGAATTTTYCFDNIKLVSL